MLRIACCAALLLAVARPATAGFITYDLKDYPALQDGYALSGTITTDGTIGDIFAANVTAWSVTFTPASGSPVTFSSTDPSNLVQVVGHVRADATAITLAAVDSGASSGDNQISLIVQDTSQSLTYARTKSGVATTNFYNGQLDRLTLAWASRPAEDALGGDPWVLAGVESGGPPVAAPVPTSLMMVLCGLVPAAAIIRRRGAR